jgi:hypothetical protein
MTANVGNTESSLKLYQLPDNAPEIAPTKAAGSAAPGVSGDGRSGTVTAPPAAAVTSQTLTVSLAPVSSVAHDPETVRATADRWSVAGSGGPAAGRAADSGATALSPLEGMRALFRVMQQFNMNARNSAVEDDQRAERIEEFKHRSSAEKSISTAHQLDDGAGLQLALTCGAAACSIGSAAVHTDSPTTVEHWHTFGISTDKVLDAAGKVGDGGAAYMKTDVEAKGKLGDAFSSSEGADADRARQLETAAKALLDRLLQESNQNAVAFKEIGEQKAKTVGFA